MYIENLCTPAILFIFLMMFHLMFELYDKEYSMALLKLICSILFILCLQLLCIGGMGLISWILVFLPVIVYSYMALLLFFVFGLNPAPSIKRFEVK